ncbi:MAG: M48 family peptidase [Gammaproteobacteria bacterium]|jgi:hypothetical protein|nr:M48 family peptidase [Gammaproteobacteria bacterium]
MGCECYRIVRRYDVGMEGQRDLFGEAGQVGWDVRRSARARRLAIRVHPDGRVEIVVPAHASASVVQSFVARHRNWIERKLAERRGHAPTDETFPPRVLQLAAFEESWPIELEPTLGATRPLSFDGRVLRVAEAATPANLRRHLLRWLLEHVRDGFAVRLETLARESSLKHASLQVRRQRTRWGSCSRRGAISLNVCGVFQRPPVLRYLMLHELVHLRHMNHSVDYWRAVEDLCPDWRALDRELTQGWRQVPRWVFEA